MVGSSSDLLGRQYGPAIDKAEAVFRVNLAPVKGYEDSVGSRTSWRVGGLNLLHDDDFYNYVQHDERSAIIQVKPNHMVDGCPSPCTLRLDFRYSFVVKTSPFPTANDMIVGHKHCRAYATTA